MPSLTHIKFNECFIKNEPIEVYIFKSFKTCFYQWATVLLCIYGSRNSAYEISEQLTSNIYEGREQFSTISPAFQFFSNGLYG
jgi:hypothetical protein